MARFDRRALLGLPLVGLAPPSKPAEVQAMVMAADQDVAALVRRAQESGTVAVIVGFSVPDGRDDEAAIAHARAALYRALKIEADAEGVLRGPGIGHVKSFATIPYVAMTLDAAAIGRLVQLPQITSVRADATVTAPP